MKTFRRVLFAVVSTLATATLATSAFAVTLGFTGSENDIGGTFFPGGAAPYVVVPWRSEGIPKTLDVDGNNVYGSAGYAMFATTATYPDANLIGGEANIPTSGDDLFPNLIDLPSWVADSEILAQRMAGGWAYSLIDDPQLVNGYRDYNWGDSQTPPVDPPHSQSPYVKLGILDGGDILGNSDPKAAPAARWGFEVGEGAPTSFRVGVMTDGLDGSIFSPVEVTLTHVVNDTPVETISSGTLSPNRFVDMHMFDITGAQPGDRFVFSARAGTDPPWSSAGISGFTFDFVSAPAVPGDYNEDGFVNAADYPVWRDHLGQSFQLPNEGDGQTPGDVTPEDYDFWKSQFAGGGGAVAVGVPEPGSIVLLLTAMMGYCRGRRRR
jgi:hypothetical protein